MHIYIIQKSKAKCEWKRERRKKQVEEKLKLLEEYTH